jgi:hypothetical protein
MPYCTRLLTQYSLFKAIKPVLECAKGKGAALLSPLPRYLLHGCCRDAEHISNRAAADFSQQLKSELRGVSANLRDFLYTANYRNIKVIVPATVFKGKEDDQIWKDDPVHPEEEAYGYLAAAAVDLCVAAGSHSCKKRPRAASDTGGRPSSRQRGEAEGDRDGGRGGNSNPRETEEDDQQARGRWRGDPRRGGAAAAEVEMGAEAEEAAAREDAVGKIGAGAAEEVAAGAAEEAAMSIIS